MSPRAECPFYPNLLQLAYCVVQFLEKESSLTEPVIPLLGLQSSAMPAHLYLLALFLLTVASAVYKPRPLDISGKGFSTEQRPQLQQRPQLRLVTTE